MPVVVLALAVAACGDDDDADTTGTETGTDTGADTGGTQTTGTTETSDTDTGTETGTDTGDTGSETGPDTGDTTDTADTGDTGDTGPIEPFTWDPRDSGPYTVGYRIVNVTYDPPATGAGRTIPVHIWYPASARTAKTPVYEGIKTDTKSFVDAPLAPSKYPGGKYPLLAHSHGDRGFAGNSAFAMRQFASHGWVAIAPDHIGNTLKTNFPGDRPTFTYIMRETDISAAIDLMDALPSGDPLTGLVDTAQVVMSGHSFGTYTCWAVAGATYDPGEVDKYCADAPCSEAEKQTLLAGFRDERVIATLPMAGTYRKSWFGETGFQSVKIPLFNLSGSDDNEAESQDQYDFFAAQSSLPFPFQWLLVEGACHQGFGFGGCDNISDRDAFSINGAYTLAFARYWKFNDRTEPTKGITEGTTKVSDLATLKRLPE